MHKKSEGEPPSFSDEAALAMSERAAAYQIQGNQPIAYVKDGLIQVEQIREIVALARDIARSNRRSFLLRFSAQTGHVQNELTAFGARIVAALYTVSPVLAQYPIHRFPPYFEIFERHASSLALFDVHGLDLVIGPEAIAWTDRLNQFVINVRREALAPQFKARLKNFARGPNDAYVQIMAYVEAHAAQNKALTLTRMDLGYLPVELRWPSIPGQSIGHTQITEHRQKFVKLASEAFGGALVGHIWKLDFSLEKGYQWHMVFLSQVLHPQDLRAILAKMGNDWNNVVTHGLGFHVDCRAFIDTYKGGGIGNFEPSRYPQQWEGIRKMAIYLTEPDNEVRLALPNNARAFGKGTMP
ncbi:hypothetical protein ABIC89_001667 [Variovorax boronicumulans]|uniref:hypothetical protein n=1 Tax=Variovorax boronicumulans TaxID=436515 RepID=UPI0033989EDF